MLNLVQSRTRHQIDRVAHAQIVIMRRRNRSYDFRFQGRRQTPIQKRAIHRVLAGAIPNSRMLPKCAPQVHRWETGVSWLYPPQRGSAGELLDRMEPARSCCCGATGHTVAITIRSTPKRRLRRTVFSASSKPQANPSSTTIQSSPPVFLIQKTPRLRVKIRLSALSTAPIPALPSLPANATFRALSP